MAYNRIRAQCYMLHGICQLLDENMRIGIDARFYGASSKGLGRYTQKLIENLEKIDIVLTDSIIPEMDGAEFIKNLRGGEYDPSIMVIMLSNMSEKEDRDKVMQLGVNGFIAKADFIPAQLVEEVKRIIGE